MEAEKYVAIKSDFGTYLTANKMDYFTCHTKTIGKEEIFKLIKKSKDTFYLITSYGKYIKMDDCGKIELQTEPVELLMIKEKENEKFRFGGYKYSLSLNKNGSVGAPSVYKDSLYVHAVVPVENASEILNKPEEEPKTLEEALAKIEELKIFDIKGIEEENDWPANKINN